MLEYNEARRQPDLFNKSEDSNGLVFLVFGRLANLVPVYTRYVPFNMLFRALESKWSRRRQLSAKAASS